MSNHYLMVQRWTPAFDWEHESIKRVAVWIRIPNLPLPCFNTEFLAKIGNSIGKTLRIDETTFATARGKFARISVEVDLEKPLKAKFEV